MLFWLELMQFNAVKRCFEKLDLNKDDSKRFVKCFAFSSFVIKKINYSFTVISSCILFFAISLLKNGCNFYSIVSAAIFSIGICYLSNHWFGLLMLFYQVIILFI